MSIAVVGGMERLGNRYREEAERFGIRLSVFNRPSKNMAARIGGTDAIVLFTNKVSHRARKEVMAVARKKDIPVLMCHSCGVCTLRECFSCLRGTGGCVS